MSNNPLLDQMFGGVGGASATRGGNYFTDGKYKAFSKEILTKTDNGLCFIAEFYIAEAASVGEKTAGGTDVIPNQPGTCSSIVIKFGDTQKEKEMARSKMKGVGLALMQLTEGEFNAQQSAENAAAAAASPPRPTRDIMAAFLHEARRSDQPFRGTAVDVSTYRKPTLKQKAQNPIPTREHWNCYPQLDAIPGQTAEMIAAQRAVVETGTGIDATPPAGVPDVQPSAPQTADPAPLPPPAPAVTPAPAPAPAPASAGSVLDKLGL